MLTRLFIKARCRLFKVVGACLIICTLASRLATPLYALTTNDVRKASVHYNRLRSITELIPIPSSSASRCTVETINFDTPSGFTSALQYLDGEIV